MADAFDKNASYATLKIGKHNGPVFWEHTNLENGGALCLVQVK
jgi:hypothetical protein